MKLTNTAIILTCLCTPVGLATSSSAAEYDQIGSYASFGGITAFESFSTDKTSNEDDAWGLQMRAGHRFNDNLAVELDFAYTDGFDMDLDLSNLVPGGIGKVTLDTTLVTTNALVYYPMGKFQPYALAGAGVMWASVRTRNTTGASCIPNGWGCYWMDYYTQLDNATEFTVKLGVGFDYILSDAWAITVDSSYVKPYGDLKDFEYVSLGWGFRYTFR